jgi:hypothetical protein
MNESKPQPTEDEQIFASLHWLRVRTAVQLHFDGCSVATISALMQLPIGVIELCLREIG